MIKSRLEAFSDGVLAIILTIMVLELKVPDVDSWQGLMTLKSVFLNYILSFVYIAIYWNNHHHLFQIVKKVNGPILWANVHLLFWLSLVPFATAWCGKNNFTMIPVLFYGLILLMAGVSYSILTYALCAHPEHKDIMIKTLGKDYKGKISVVLYAMALGLCYYKPIVSLSLYILVAIMWLIPDKRIEKVFLNPSGGS